LWWGSPSAVIKVSGIGKGRLLQQPTSTAIDMVTRNDHLPGFYAGKTGARVDKFDKKSMRDQAPYFNAVGQGHNNNGGVILSVIDFSA